MNRPPEKRIIADKYEVIGVLGEGGTGIVYDALTKDGNAVALKVMHPSLAGDHQIRGRFQREATILRRLGGDHVCPILDFGETPGDEPGRSLLYIALPKINGESLADLLARGPIDMSRALDILLEVLAALEEAHAQGIIHRDLKPANVLLEAGTKVFVVDFGMSKIITGSGLDTTNLTAHNMLFGTPEYMSPEQARGDELDARCDVYSAGVMLYEVLTGAPPFTGPSALSVLTAHLTSTLEPPSTRPRAAGRVTPALESVVLHALARDPDKRYPSAGAFAAALRHARAKPNDVLTLRHVALSAPSPRASETATATGPTTSTHRDAIDAIDAMAPTLIATPPTFVSQRPAIVRPPAALLPRHHQSSKTWLLVWVIVGLASISVGVWFALRR